MIIKYLLCVCFFFYHYLNGFCLARTVQSSKADQCASSKQEKSEEYTLKSSWELQKLLQKNLVGICTYLGKI